LVREGGYQPDYCALVTEGVVVFPWDREVVDEESGRLVVNPDYLGIIDSGEEED
jgi:hypothetical protein